VIDVIDVIGPLAFGGCAFVVSIGFAVMPDHSTQRRSYQCNSGVSKLAGSQHAPAFCRGRYG
jgi:hypothetical protein